MTTLAEPPRPEEVPADDPIIRITRDVAAPPALVWSAWTDPSRVSRWWGPVGFTTTTHSHDLRPGGEWHFTMHGPDGTDYGNRVVYETIEPERLLTYAHYAAGDPDDKPHFHARHSFEPTAKGTRITMTLHCHDLAHRDHLMTFGAVQGGRDTLARFAAMVEAG
jgi:uncharacterized protein YndB with AHSA1/START domain